MARTTYSKITTKTDRLKLAISETPYLYSLEPGRVLGYIKKGEKIPGTWIVRKEVKRLPTGPVRRRVTLGSADDFSEANGDNILDYNQARAKALSMIITEDGAVGKRGAFSLEDAVEQHKTFGGRFGNKTLRGKVAAFNSLRWNLLGLNSDGTVRDGVTIIRKLDDEGNAPKSLFALDKNMPVADLTCELLTALRAQWIDEEQSPSSLATALRKWTDINSCLQRAFLKTINGITSPAAWQTVYKMDQEQVSRKLHFRDEEAVAILDHIRAANVFAADYLEAIYRFGCRPGGEVFALRVRHFNPEQRTLAFQPRSETVRTKDISGRHVGLAPSALAFITRVIGGRKGSEVLFTQDGTNAWDSDACRYVIKPLLVAAVREVLGAGAFEGDDALTEDAIIPYAFRHTFISRRAARGMPAGTIARVCGTSEYMIKKNYEHAFPSETEQWLIDTDVKQPLKVVKTA